MLWIKTGSNEEKVIGELTKLYGKHHNQHRFICLLLSQEAHQRRIHGGHE